jgi:hypothetical protein
MRRWVKLHTKILMSPSMGRLTDHAYRACINLMALGGYNDEGGMLGTAKDIAYHLRVTVDDALASLKEIAVEGIIVERKGVWYLQNWDKYQSNAPSAENGAVLERVKKHRKSKAKDDDGNSVTPPLHSESNDPRIDKNREEEIGADAPPPPVDPVKELAAIFQQTSGVTLPQPTTKKAEGTVGVTWWNPLREMVKMANGSAPEIMRRAVEQMRRDDLTIGSPKSVEKVFASIHGKLKTSGTFSESRTPAL